MRITVGWWTLVGLGVVTWVGASFTWNDDTTTTIPASCVKQIHEDRVHQWIDRLGGWANYDGTTGYWYDASGAVVGMSSAEDSDICSFV